jgi:hypothetical protein
MSKEMLKTVLETKEASTMDVLRGSLKRALGAGAGAGAAVPTLEAMGLDQSSPLLWGLVTSAGVLGHDLAGAAGKGYSKHLQKVSCARRDKKILLQKLGKCSTGRKKKLAAMEKPFSKEYSLTKEANLIKQLNNIASQKKLEQALQGALGTVGAGAGGLGSYGLIHSLAPGGFSRHAILETTPLLGGGMVLGGLAAAHAGKGLGKGINYIRNPKAYKARNTLTEALSNLTKTSSLSRAAKGAIALPAAALALGPLAAATHMPYVADDMVKQLAGGIGKLDDVPGFLKTLYGPLKVPALFEREGQVLSGNVFPEKTLAGIAGLSALGAGAGKLSERFIPVAKKSILEDPKKKKMLMAAALFPWMSTAAGVSYLANRAMGSDS